MKIDIHTHFIPSEVINDARRGQAPDNIKIEKRNDTEWIIHPQGYQYPLDVEFWDVEAKLRQMDKLGLDKSILSISPTFFLYWADAALTVEFCQMANEAVAEMVKQSGGRLLGMATVPLQDPQNATRELHRAVSQLGLRGVEIGTVMEDVPLDDPRFEPFFAAADELNTPVMLHPYYVGPKSQLSDFYLTNLIGNPLETSIAASRLVCSGCLDRHPGLKVILVHAGGFFPYQIGRLDHGYKVRSETNAHIKQLPSTYLDRFYFDTITHAKVPLKFLIELVGKEHVVIGTDTPFDMADTDFTQRLSSISLNSEAVNAIQSQNVIQLFGLN